MRSEEKVSSGWMERLAKRWGVAPGRVLVILLVFACTGFTIMFLKRPVLSYFSEAREVPVWHSVLYYLLILPVYNVVLLIYGALFGQFAFFWAFEKRLVDRLLRRRGSGKA